MDHMTAKVSCFSRAYHYDNNNVHIFSDAFAKQLLGDDYEQIARSMIEGIGFFFPNFQGSTEEGLRLIVDQQLSPSVLGRSAYCERMMEKEKQLGCTQYILFASGFDSLAIRNKDNHLTIFELDLPALVANKKRRIDHAGLKSSAITIPCNLLDSRWSKQLMDTGFACEKKSFGSLLGLSYYFSHDDFYHLLKQIGDMMCQGSAICFDYPEKDDSKETRINQALAQEANEDMKAQYSYVDIERLLEKCGFLIYEHLDHYEMTSQYFSHYNEANPEHQMAVPKGVCYVYAVKQ
ncbi:MAG: class I SAM-dependent methyltransferase [Erysipelotrichaceae bacterium]|nr:class I SAM-dependent methyltransferase [Erysipelotrichaceae bacterium]